MMLPLVSRTLTDIARCWILEDEISVLRAKHKRCVLAVTDPTRAHIFCLVSNAVCWHDRASDEIYLKKVFSSRTLLQIVCVLDAAVYEGPGAGRNAVVLLVRIMIDMECCFPTNPNRFADDVRCWPRIISRQKLTKGNRY